METSMRSIAIGFCALALSAPVASAQQSLESSTPGPTVESQAAEPAAQTAAETSVKAEPVGPTIEAAAVGFRVSADKNASLTAAQAVRRGQGQDVALMAVGVGAMIVGAIVGGTAGTVILIGGAAMALFGLYNYLE